MLSHILREAVLPPGCLLILLAVALLLRQRKPHVTTLLVAGTAVSLYLLSIPPVSLALSRWAEGPPAVTIEQVKASGAQAIVVLGGGAELAAPEYDGATVPSSSTLQRVTYASYLARHTGLPLLVTGGYGANPEQSEAWAMKEALEAYGTPARWLEPAGTNTYENAASSRALLEPEGIGKVVVVTHASHAGRAAATFQKAGFHVLAAPTGFRSPGPWDRGLMLAVPTAEHLHQSCDALRSQFSLAWYWLRGR